MCSLLSNQKKPTGAKDYESVGKYVMHCGELGINVRNPDINLSKSDFTVVDGEILYGLGLIKGVGNAAVKAISQRRDFKSFDHFLEVLGNEPTTAINKTVIIALIKAGCFDFTGQKRRELLEQYRDYMFWERKGKHKPVKQVNKNHIKKLLDMGLILSNQADDKETCVDVWNDYRYSQHREDWDEKDMAGDEYFWEFNTLSYYLSGNPFEELDFPSWDSFKDGDVGTLVAGTVVSIKRTKIKRGKSAGRQMAFVNLDSTDGMREVVFFSDAWDRVLDRVAVEKGATLVIKGKKQKDKLIAGGAMTMKQYQNMKTKE